MPPTVHVSEYDIGRSYNVTLIDENGSAFTIPTGTTATVEGTLNGAVGFTTSATISGNQISFNLTESMTAYAGNAWCKIKLTLNDEPIQTCAFILAVDRAGVEAETVIGASGFEQQIVDAVNDWLDEHGGGDPETPVQSVNGKTGVVVLRASDVDAMDVNAPVVKTTPQTLTTDQKTQARTNIGAGKSTVSYNQSTGVLTIIDAESSTPTAYPVPSDTVRYGAAQTLTEAQKTQARTNIGAGTSNVTDAVQYTAQTLTTAQKEQARANISAGTTTTRVNASDGTITITDPTFASGNPMTYQYRTIFQIIAVYSNGEYTFDRNQADILSAIVRGQLPVVRYHTTAGQSDYDVYYEWVFDYYTYDGEDVYIFFDRIDQYGNISQMKWYGSTGKAVVVEGASVPKATSADEGKIPMVNSFGNYQLVSIPAAETTSFGT